MASVIFACSGGSSSPADASRYADHRLRRAHRRVAHRLRLVGEAAEHARQHARQEALEARAEDGRQVDPQHRVPLARERRRQLAPRLERGEHPLELRVAERAEHLGEPLRGAGALDGGRRLVGERGGEPRDQLGEVLLAEAGAEPAEAPSRPSRAPRGSGRRAPP